jgi:type V secretory pathway adhesin AidA
MAKAYKLGMKRKLENSVTRAMAKRGKGSVSELGVVGRSSGRHHIVIVSPSTIDGSTYVVAPYGAVNWVHNVRANPNVTLSRDGITTRYRAIEVGGEEAGRVLSRYYAKNKKHVARYMDIPGEGTIMDYAAAAEQYPVFRLESH